MFPRSHIVGGLLLAATVEGLLVQRRHPKNDFVGPIKSPIIPRYGYSRSSCMPEVPNEEEEA